MNLYAQLTQLIFSFYRENPYQLEEIRCLQSCKLSRRWGVLKIICPTFEVAEALVLGINTLKEPIAQLRLAQQIEISVNRAVVQHFTVPSSRLTA
ncbi:hypothetical protein [Leptolyngbya sp. GB1-A1]|jgi:hypothetical protein|uniref:hypothetical protein n=1 Tax=unclassified Leptolyngbya TaxID=2650499 RepID=UPI003296E5C5